jgi:putative tryptophan/tyrosine transport system substrate-binding protein
VKRREFIALLGGTAAWPRAARAQQSGRMPRVAVLMATAESDPEIKARVNAFRQRLQELGWTDGRNIRIDYRFAAGDPTRLQAYAAELVGLAPDVIFLSSPPTLRVVREQTQTIPIVFVGVADPVGAGFVESLIRPGGNMTGFTNFEFSIAGKWLQLLKELVPRTTRVAVLHNPENPTAFGYLRMVDAMAPSAAVQVTANAARDAGEIEHAFDMIADKPSDGLIVLPEVSTTLNRELIITLAARHRLPAVYPFRYFAERGGLISYGPQQLLDFHQAASYVDRILRGAKPSDLPVQAPTKYELVINLKTAKALGLDVPLHFQQLADEVIE